MSGILMMVIAIVVLGGASVSYTHLITTEKITPTIIACVRLRDESTRLYLSALSAWLAWRCMIFKLIEYRAICVRIPAKIGGMPSFVCKLSLIHI